MGKAIGVMSVAPATAPETHVLQGASRAVQWGLEEPWLIIPNSAHS